MKKNGILWLSLAIVLVLVVGIVLAATHFVFVNGHVYPKQAQALDLRDRELTVEDYEAIARKLPQCYLVWNIPFQGGTLSSDSETLTVTTLTDEDVQVLEYAVALRTVDGWNCQDYAQLAQLQQRHPNATVRFHMTISGQDCDQDTRKLSLKGLSEEDARRLTYLPKLSQVAVSQCENYELLMRLQQEYPQWNLSYTVQLGETEYDWDSKTIQAEDATCDQLAAALPALPNLTQLQLVNPEGEGEALLGLRDTYTQVEMHWQLERYGQTVTDETTQWDISGVEVASCEEVEQAAAFLPALETLIMSDCGIDNETMAAFRERQRDNYKVVWTVYLGTRRAVRTDEEKLFGNCYFWDEELVNLKYCEDMIAIDIGHSGAKNIDFVAYMPHLTYFIIADTGVRDLTALSNCKELIWLELGWCNIESYEPLLGCTALEDLNIGRTFADPAPISKMTWLKNLWCMERSAAVQAQWREDLPDTNIVGIGTDVVAYGWRRLPNYYKMRDALDMYYMS